MHNNSFFKKAFIIFSVVSLYSCDKDYNSIGSDLIGGNHFDFLKYSSDVVSYNQKVTAIQSNNQAINPLGIYDDPDFGTTTANFVTQVSLGTTPSIINSSTVTIESVVLNIPYFVDATQTVTNTTDGSHTYVLDSIYGDANGKIKLSVFRSDYYLRNLDRSVNFADAQKYYTNQNSDFSAAKVGTRLNDDTDTSQNDEFVFSNIEHIDTPAVTDVSAAVFSVPSMRLNLNKAAFKTAIIDGFAAGKFGANADFSAYYKGLYFQIEKSGANPSRLAMLNFAGGTITINYTDETSTTDDTRIAKSIVLNLTGNTVSLLEHTAIKTAYANATNSADPTLGDNKLYVKGGEGAMSVIKLFDKGELATIKGNGWLVNEANLIFYVDNASFTGDNKPQRLYLYDYTNHRPLVDYYYDASSGTTAKKGKTTYGGLLTTDASGNSIYKFRITNHVRNLIQKDSTNIKLGLVVTENINNITSAKLKTSTANFSQAPQASVMNPLGIVLFGNNIPTGDSNFNKRLKLEIYYTKPN